MLALVLALGAAGCGDGDAGGSGTAAAESASERAPAGDSETEAAAGAGPAADAPADSDGTPATSPARQVRDLIAALTPLPEELAMPAQSEWFLRRKATLEKLREAGEAVGREALRQYRLRADGAPAVREGLLDVAAHTVPGEAAPILEELVRASGGDMAVREAACALLAVAEPERAVELFSEILTLPPERVTVTYPSGERMLAAWNDAARRLGIDRGRFLADVLTNARLDAPTRYKAAKALGTFESEIGREALRAMVLEHTSDGYVRRLAAQSLQATASKEELCGVLEEATEHEHDTNVLLFFADMMEENGCL